MFSQHNLSFCQDKSKLPVASSVAGGGDVGAYFRVQGEGGAKSMVLREVVA